MAASLCACPSDHTPLEPPLRPLVYTENPDQQTVGPVPGYEMWSGDGDPTAYPDEPPLLQEEPADDRVAPDQVDLSTPEALARAVFAALAGADAELLEHLMIQPVEYAESARTSISRAQRHLREVDAELDEVVGIFRGEVASEQRPGGLGAMLQLDAVNVRSYRTVHGEIVDHAELGEMVLGTEVLMRLRGTEQVFRLRLPKVLRTRSGLWRLAEAPEVGGMLLLFTQMGFHLSPRLLAFEHYPLPLLTGNYWSYQVRTEARHSNEVEARIERAASGSVDRPDEDPETVGRDPDLPRELLEVAAREDYDGYSLVRLQRSRSDSDAAPDQEVYLLTARRVYRCDRDCRRNIDDIDWLLDHLSRRTPELIFPLRPGIGWRTGGRLSIEGEYRTRSQPEVAHVPAGRFEDTICVTRSTSEGREHRFVAAGIGTVLTRIEGATETTHIELVDYRIIP